MLLTFPPRLQDIDFFKDKQSVTGNHINISTFFFIFENDIDLEICVYQI